MNGFRTFVIMGGGVILFVVLATLLFMMMPTRTAHAEESATEVTVGPMDYLADAGAAGWIILLLGVGCIVVTVFGAVLARKEGAWPHWRRRAPPRGEARPAVSAERLRAALSQLAVPRHV